MAHSEQLINSILNNIKKSYPVRMGYQYIVEKKIISPGVRLFPDIQVIKGGKLKCVVEIGYTRPEKLKRYRVLKIPDIRWYSKKGELINPFKKNETIIRKYKINPLERWEILPLFENNFLEAICDSCFSAAIEEEFCKKTERDSRSNLAYIYEYFMPHEGLLFTNGNLRFAVYKCLECLSYFLSTYLDGQTDNYLGDYILRYPFGCDGFNHFETHSDFLKYKGRLGREGVNGAYADYEEIKQYLSGVGIDLNYDEIKPWGHHDQLLTMAGD